MISTIGNDGKRNLAPFTFFQLVSTHPPFFVMRISQITGMKNTTSNLLETGEGTISIPFEWMEEALNYISINARKEVDEFD